MAKPVIAIDVDEVLFPFTEEYIKEHNRLNNTAIEPSEIETWKYIEELSGLSDEDDAEDAIESFLDLAYSNKIGPYNGAIEAIEQLSQKYDMVVITARRFSMRDVTERWLERHFPGVFKEVHLARTAEGGGIPKSVVCKQVGADVMIDDHITNAEDCAAAGIRVLLFGDYGWSKDWKLPDGVTKVKDWDAVVKELM